MILSTDLICSEDDGDYMNLGSSSYFPPETAFTPSAAAARPGLVPLQPAAAPGGLKRVPIAPAPVAGPARVEPQVDMQWDIGTRQTCQGTFTITTLTIV